ncbi:restriction endonuclease subunit S [Pseudoxanthomonas mexicana]|uniref:restriction endonuclease subunit S n=1 Tax=Pseudoxanthomonas mexicana TaxID=128785 RepID=UPI0020A07512|nr:restriction endonuclease subunit S [Pseudoxanthomonas mexicana]MCP1584664.1 type I restriction enzyme S subunit [Pseudoxanthomonas mexicana]
MAPTFKRTPERRFPDFFGMPGWTEKKLGDLFLERVSKGHPNKPVLSASQERGVIPYALLEKSVIRDNQNLSGYKLVKSGDFVISLRSFEGGFEYSQYEGIISPAYVVLKRAQKIDEDFFRFLFKSDSFVRAVKGMLNNNLRDGKSISYNQAKNLRIFVPDLPEQARVAACLSSIDSLIAVQSRMLSGLKDQKRGLMQQLFPAPEGG